MVAFFRALFARFAALLAFRNLRADRFGTFAAIVGVALGAATVNVVLVLDGNTRALESGSWTSNPDLDVKSSTISLKASRADGSPIEAADAKTETHEDYEVMRSAIRLGSLSAYLVGALIVFFTFAAVVARKKREVALYRSLGALPEQIAAIFVREAVIIAFCGAALGVLAAIPLSVLAAAVGMTTTGRARIRVHEMTFPIGPMVLVAAIGAGTALLGVIRPVREILRAPFADALAGREGEALPSPGRVRGLARIALPFSALLFVLLRPFMKNALPSLAFFAVEAGVVCALALLTVMLVPDVVMKLGRLLGRILSVRNSAVRLLVTRRIARRGGELGIVVAGLMLVFALLLSLHIAVFALTREVTDWARGGVDKCLFLVPDRPSADVERVARVLPERATTIRFSSRTPWPNAVLAVERGGLLRWAQTTRRPGLVRLAMRFGPGTIMLSKMMARRFRVSEGDSLEVSGKGGTRKLRVAGVTDEIGYVMAFDTYRNGKTYGIIDEEDADLIAPYSKGIGTMVVALDSERPHIPDFRALTEPIREAQDETDGAFLKGVRVIPGDALTRERVRETGRDFWIFDVILALTTLLAAIGTANQLAIFVHARRGELLLYRTLGMTAGDIRKIVLGEGAFAGLLGGILAVMLGVPLGYATIGALRAVSAFDVEFALPVEYVLFTIGGTVLISVLAALYPARKAVAQAGKLPLGG